MLFETMIVDFKHSDEKGVLTQLVHEGYNQVNVLYSNQGIVRGNHYHKLSCEVFYIVNGSVEVELKKINSEYCEKVFFKMGDFFQILPYTLHRMYFPEECVMVVMYDHPIEKKDGSKDIYQEGE